MPMWTGPNAKSRKQIETKNAPMKQKVVETASLLPENPPAGLSYRIDYQLLTIVFPEQNETNLSAPAMTMAHTISTVICFENFIA